MRRRQINFLPIATGPSITIVRQTLDALGYSIRTLAAIHETLTSKPRLDRMLVMMFGDENYPREQLIDYLRSGVSPYALLIFDNTKIGFDQDLVRHCEQFVFWPCPSHELDIRLKLINDNFESKTSVNEYAALPHEFLHLNLIGRSAAFLEVLNRIKKISNCDAPVLIEGETGTGKELAARAIHYMGARAEQPFIPINCGALPETLIENELFGHVRGAYTGANVNSEGLVARAAGGTLFLDEIDSLPLKAQVVLLRFLQDKRYLPLGTSKFSHADVRIIVASNHPLSDLVETGSFRQDLFYRLNLMYLKMPRLSDRSGDIPLLAQHFLNSFRSQYKQAKMVLHPSMIRFLQMRDWPGNVRELENYLHREFLLAEGGQLLAPDKPETVRERRQGIMDRRSFEVVEDEFSKAKTSVVNEFECRYLRTLLKETQGNVTLAARRARKERRAFGKLLKKHGIRREDFLQ